MTKKRIISLIVVSILVIVGLVSPPITARMIIDNRVALNRGTGSLPPSTSSAPFAGFEIGDGIYRKLHFKFVWLLGHAGIYWHWVPDEKGDPTIKANHKTIEAFRLAWWKMMYRMRLGEVSSSDFEKFTERNDFWGVGAHKLHYKDRRKLVKNATSQRGTRYALTRGYKSPGKSFRCDGLVEWCYESVGVDIVPNDWFMPWRNRTWLTPALQWFNSSARIGKFQELRFGTKEDPDEVICIDGEPISLEDGKYKVYGEVEVKIYASDLDDDNDGSGITRLELWVGEPDDTPEEMPGLRLLRDDTDYPADNDYTCTWDTTQEKDGEPLFPNGDYPLKAIAFDQAGNKKEATLQVEVANAEKYLCVRAEPVFLANSGGTCKITVELWDYGECPEAGCLPEGCVRKKEGTQSWYYDDVEGKYMLEKCCEEFEMKPAPCDDEEFSAVVELSPLHVLGESAGLYKDDDWDGTIEITYQGGKVCGSIGGIGYRDINGNLLPSDNRRTVLISARCNVAKGAGILMINPIILKPTEHNSEKRLSSRRFAETYGPAWFGAANWARVLEEWDVATYGAWGYFSDKVIGPSGQLMYCKTVSYMDHHVNPHYGYRVSALKIKLSYHAVHPDTGEILTDVVSATPIAEFDGIYGGGGANVYYTPDAPGVSGDDELHPIIKCVTTGVSVTVTNEWDAEHGQYEFGDVKSIFDGSEFVEVEFHPDDSIVPDFQPFGNSVYPPYRPYWNKEHRIKFKNGLPYNYPWIMVVPKAEE